jgi:uncharacterized protein (TIGR00369 family)
MPEDDIPPASADAALALVAATIKFVPQAQALGLEITRVERARAWGRAPYRADLAGETGIIAGGVVTTFLDQLCGAAVGAALDTPGSVATLDLRIDYMRPAEPGRDLLAQAHCYKVTRNVAFVRAVAFEDSPDEPVAHAAAAFMLNSSAGRKPGANLAPRKKAKPAA